ncbi:amino acid adenylation domain-containing protein [Thalassomonas sp. RHCl1]|uniref:non-ribosomal peptide synthetase n=1 Tax=Thalassomonas sp. RHCl1 TaxID=2995320 RepID=UPI00248D05E6|nr:amino acid adenylation domain-containing protein [Thalassomonas sp. RHCl1]
MTIEVILEKCAEQAVELYVEDEQLQVLFDETPDDELIALLRENKQQLLGYLSQQQAHLVQMPPVIRSHQQTAPLSHSQKRLWFLDQLENGSSQYNMPLALRLQGDVNTALLQQTLQRIVQRHEILRTVYDKFEQVQEVKSDVSLDTATVDLSHNQNGQDAELAKLISEQASTPFDLQQDVMMRAKLVKLAEKSYVLLLTLHHIACDGWSTGVLVKDFVDIYSALSGDKAADLPELSVQYSDYALWQQQQENSEQIDNQLGYWLEQLNALPAVHSFPLDHVRPAHQDFEGHTLSRTVSQSTLETARNFCREHDVTLFMLMQTVFSLILGRWSNEQDIVMGTPIAGRSDKVLEPLIGFFANTLVLRATLDEKHSFARMLELNKQVLLDAYQHQDIPFETLVDRLQPERSLAFSPLFQILFSFHNHDGGNLSLPGLEITDITEKAPLAKFDMELSILEQDDSLLVQWNYAKSLFLQDTVERVAASFEHLLAQVLADAGKSIYAYDILPVQDEAKLVQYSGMDKPAGDSPANILELFRQQVARYPQARALVFKDRELTFAQLDQASNRLAHYLLQQGVVANQTVGLMIPPGPEMVTGLLGILKSGAAYLPLEASYPQSRLDDMLSDSRTALVLDETHLSEQALAGYAIDDSGLPAISAQQLAYVIYTSGSTGKPKGVMISHGNVSHFIKAMSLHLPVQAGEDIRWLAVTGISFDISVLEIFGTLVNGAQVILAEDTKPAALEAGQSQSSQGISELIARHQVTHIQCTPAFAQIHLVGAKAGQLDSLEKIFLGGEALPPGLVQQLQEHTCAAITNMYGPTEATVWATCYELQGQESQIPIGRPLAGYSCYVLDRQGNRQPIGCPGELFIGGAGVSQGYYNRPELTREKFVDSPVPGSGLLYGTGDRASWGRDGQLRFHGRLDQQVKLRGFRIEPGEIEHQLGKFEQVRDVAVAAREFQPGDLRLVAWIVLTGDPEVDSKEKTGQLKQALSDYLPEHMIPAHFVFLGGLPRTLNGKLDRKQLPAPEYTGAAENEPLKTDTEHQLAQIWKTLLAIENSELSRQDSFFAIGGNSLLISRLLAQLQGHFQIELTIRELFEHSILSAMAQVIDNALKARAEQDKYAQLTTTDSSQTEEFLL